jgi:hypothetical protein
VTRDSDLPPTTVCPDGNTSSLIFISTVTAGLSDAINNVGSNEEIDFGEMVAAWANLACPSYAKEDRDDALF